MEFVTRCFRAFRYRKIVWSPRLLAILSSYRDIRDGDVGISKEGRLTIAETDVAVDTEERQFLLQGIQLISDLRQRAGAGVSTDRNGRVVINTSGVNIIVDCWEELFIAHEILFKRIYNVSLNKPFHVVDVGMNTGTSALFFASQPNCLHVDAYELFPQTAARATENLSLNPEISHKICAHSYGLGLRDEDLWLDYVAEFKGSIGKNGLPDYAKPQGVKLHTEKVLVKICAVGQIVRELMSKAGDTAMVLKLDCEGAEYEILPALRDDNLLERFSVVMIEWHLRGPLHLKEMLKRAGFSCLSFDELSGTHGMLYGFQTGGGCERR